MKKLVQKVVQMTSQVPKEQWVGLEKEILQNLVYLQKSDVADIALKFSVEKKGTNDFWAALEPVSLKYLKLFTEEEAEKVIAAYTFNSYKMQNEDFKTQLEILTDAMASKSFDEAILENPYLEKELEEEERQLNLVKKSMDNIIEGNGQKYGDFEFSEKMIDEVRDEMEKDETCPEEEKIKYRARLEDLKRKLK